MKNNLPKTTDTAGGFSEDEPLLIGGNEPNEKAQFTNDLIWFNGQTPKELRDEFDLGHETFVIKNINTGGVNGWNFCKTARKPYDLLVCACLIAARKYLGFRISSDGSLNDWKPAFDYYGQVMGIKRVVRSKRRFLNEK
ncbi:MAG: hypothetical protein U9Q27_00410 [Patescibacteria group bacterium]|nr:hypothetical protein [Patescibacteria group bacterium]